MKQKLTGWITELIPQAKNGNSLPRGIDVLPLNWIYTYYLKTEFIKLSYLARICWTAAGGKVPFTTETLTAALSKVLPFSVTHVMPPPPFYVNLT